MKCLWTDLCFHVALGMFWILRWSPKMCSIEDNNVVWFEPQVFESCMPLTPVTSQYWEVTHSFMHATSQFHAHNFTLLSPWLSQPQHLIHNTSTIIRENNVYIRPLSITVTFVATLYAVVSYDLYQCYPLQWKKKQCFSTMPCNFEYNGVIIVYWECGSIIVYSGSTDPTQC